MRGDGVLLSVHQAAIACLHPRRSSSRNIERVVSSLGNRKLLRRMGVTESRSCWLVVTRFHAKRLVGMRGWDLLAC